MSKKLKRANASNISQQAENITGMDLKEMKDSLNKASKKLVKLLDSAGDELSDASNKLLADIRNKPLRAVLAVTAVGIITAALIRRS